MDIDLKSLSESELRSLFLEVQAAIYLKQQGEKEKIIAEFVAGLKEGDTYHIIKSGHFVKILRINQGMFTSSILIINPPQAGKDRTHINRYTGANLYEWLLKAVRIPNNEFDKIVQQVLEGK